MRKSKSKQPWNIYYILVTYKNLRRKLPTTSTNLRSKIYSLSKTCNASSLVQICQVWFLVFLHLLYHFLCCFSQLSIMSQNVAKWLYVKQGARALPFLIEGMDWRGKRVVIAGMGAFAVENVQGTQGSKNATLKRHWVLIPTWVHSRW